MSRRVGHSTPPVVSRESILQAWLKRHDASIKAHGGRSTPLVKRRLKALVGQTAGAFHDIPASLHGAGKVGWQAEPVDPDGRGVERFTALIERLGPIAVEVMIQGRRLLDDPDLRLRLSEAGILSGTSKGQLEWLVAMDQGGERMLTCIGRAMAQQLNTDAPISVERLLEITRDPNVHDQAVETFMTEAVQTAELMAQLTGQHPTQDLWVTDAYGEVEPLDSRACEPEGPDAVIAAARNLCAAECRVGAEDQRPLSAEQYEGALYDLVSRWARPAAGGPSDDAVVILDTKARVRFAHTLLHPRYFLYVHEPTGADDPTQSWKAMYVWFETDGVALLQRRAASIQGLDVNDKNDLAQDNIEENLRRLRGTFLDSYVDPSREPDDWDRVRLEVTTLRDAGRFYGGEQVPDGDLTDLESRAAAAGATVSAPWAAPADLDPVDTDYWRERDLHLTQATDFLHFVQQTRRQREPYASYDELVYFTQRLLPAADQELGRRDRTRFLTRDEFAAAEEWIANSLERTISPNYRQIPRHTKVNRERAELGWLVPGIDIEAAVIEARPRNLNQRDCAIVALVVRAAFLRAVVLVFGRRGLDMSGNGDD